MSSIFLLFFIGRKTSLLIPFFLKKIAPKPQHLVVKPHFSSSEPHFVIIIIVSTWLEHTKKMPLEPGTPLALGYISE